MKTIPLTNLIIPGAAKSSTTSLHQYLNLHPQILMSNVKEPHFFSIDRQFQKGTEYYNSIYERKDETHHYKYFGESSTTYLHHLESHKRIKNTIPDPKFIIILRNPIDRIYSHYTWLYNLAYENKPFKEAILKDLENDFNPNYSINGCYKFYIGTSLYSESILNLIELFEKSRIFIVSYEEFQKNRPVVLDSIFAFLDITRIAIEKNIEANTTKEIIRVEQPFFIKLGKKIVSTSVKQKVKTRLDPVLKKYFGKAPDHKPLDKETRLWLKQYFLDDVKKLKEYTGNNFSEWQDFND